MPRFLVELFGVSEWCSCCSAFVAHNEPFFWCWTQQLPKKSIFRVEGKKATRAFDSDDDDDDAAAAGDADDSS